MSQDFDRDFWEQHWQRGETEGGASMASNPPNAYVVAETGGLEPGTALDAGCGAGAEAIWLALNGWTVTGADISSHALERAGERAAASGASDRLQWVEADLSTWDPGRRFDLVVTSYAHATLPQLELYDRLASWVAPGGTLLIVGHLHHEDGSDAVTHGHGHDSHGDADWQPPPETTVDAAGITARLDASTWEVVTAQERRRAVKGEGGREATLHDVVVRAVRRA